MGDRRRAGQRRAITAEGRAETATGPGPAPVSGAGQGPWPDRRWCSSGRSGHRPGAEGAVGAPHQLRCVCGPPSLAVTRSPGCDETAPGETTRRRGPGIKSA
ncbi:hypothetical protein NDU88_005667 [Pleurodeles waltl]|uniref:Uncharacterized protein n=1 Tax=Pleurodeles waltl TaxID=8319 RepID=A0AAV7LNA7_PLEWA|nr:hypothetical protein NDU88_005667 [Pleurodeles waltl]